MIRGQKTKSSTRDVAFLLLKRHKIAFPYKDFRAITKFISFYSLRSSADISVQHFRPVNISLNNYSWKSRC